MGRGYVFEETGDVLWGADTMRYVIRRLENNCWLDVLGFSSETEIGNEEAEKVVTDKLAENRIAVISPTLFCLVRQLNNGREQTVGGDVTVGRTS